MPWRGGPAFPDAWSEFLRWRANGLLIGRSLGFEFCHHSPSLQGVPWIHPRALDTRLLAEACAPRLAGYDLDTLAAWLGVTVEDRHSATGGAIIAAKLLRPCCPICAKQVFGRLPKRNAKAGLFSIVSAAWVLAIRHGIAERGTRARFERVQALSLGHDADLESLASAQALFLDLLVDQQLLISPRR